MNKKTLQYEVHAQGEMPRMLACPDGQLFVDTKEELYVFVPKGETDEEKHNSAKHFSMMCILGGIAVPQLRKVCTVVEKFVEIPYKEVKIIEKDGDKFASYNMSAGGDLELAVEGETAALYVDNKAKAFYLKEKHPKTFLARIEGEKFVKDLGKKSDEGDEEATMTLELMQEYVCLKDEHIID